MNILNHNSESIEWYKCYHCNRKDRLGCGISIFIKNNVVVETVPLSYQSLPEIEFIHINIYFGDSNNIKIIAIYRITNQSLINDFVTIIDGIQVEIKLK